MSLKSMVAVLAIAALPVCAQAQQQKAAPKSTKADAQRVVKLIGGDKAKTQIYCDIAKLGDQIEQAAGKKDEKTVEALSEKVDELGSKIGPEYVALMDGLQDVDPDSKVGKEIGMTLEALDKLCGK